jgi:hypothetical protein
LIKNDGVEIPAKNADWSWFKSYRLVAVQCRNSRWYCDQDFVVAILQDKTCAPDSGLWIPSFTAEILNASHNLLTKTGARMATKT